MFTAMGVGELVDAETSASLLPAGQTSMRETIEVMFEARTHFE